MIRLLDIVLSCLALAVFLPFGILIAGILRLTGEREVFYRQDRVGKEGRRFGLLKFATMLKDSPSIGSGDITVKDDPRVLPLGSLLRKTKLNEVPQLLNILLGDMSVVGPRPQTPKNFDYFPTEGKRIITSMKPGLTGIGSLVFRDEETLVSRSKKSLEACYREDIGPYKAELETWHHQHQGLSTYLMLIVFTLWVIVWPTSNIYRRVWSTLPPLPEDLRR
jgi:lipopolysaccharide/colanic/teichoic acid biosynthesis glycosyltransferase